MIIPAAPLLVLCSALIFGIGISVGWPNYIALSLFYIVIIFGVAVLIIQSILSKAVSVGVGYIASLTMCNHVGILLGFSIGLGPDYMLWPDDTIDHHLPNAIAFSEWLSGIGTLEIFTDNPFAKVYISNMWVGIFFYVFGTYPVVSGFAMLLIKLIAVALIYYAAFNFLKDKSVASIAAIIYGLLPTLTFYTLQFYKDFFIHFLVALVLFIISKSIKRQKYAIFLVLPLGAMFVERFYLLVMICVTLVLYYWSQSGKVGLKISIFVLGGGASLAVLDYYFAGQGIIELIITIQEFEAAQNESIDATPTTYIALDLFRSAFTPFFNFYKLNSYSHLDSILIFGGFIHQLTMIFYFKGLWVARKDRVIILNYAFLFLIVILALIMPYAGRARDSLYPLVSLFAAIGISSVWGRKRIIDRLPSA